MFWPYMFMVITGPIHGLTGGDYVSFAIGDLIGLAIVAACFTQVNRFATVRRLGPPAAIALGVFGWPLPLLVFQIITWLVLVNLLGWSTI